VVLHTRQQRIFGIAFGMDALAFLLPSSLHPEALAAGGTVDADIDDEWIEWRHTTMLDTKRWCKAAHDYAVGREADKRQARCVAGAAAALLTLWMALKVHLKVTVRPLRPE
jgi:hypothetical protein